MPREDRRIIFEHEEVYKALYSLCVQKELKPPPAGTVGKVIVHPVDPTKVLVQIRDDRKQTAIDVEFSRDFLAAALMLFCRGHRIPLPKSAQKAVELDSANVVLRVLV